MPACAIRARRLPIPTASVEIIIGTTGQIQIDAVGFKGPDCEKATQFLEAALGGVGKKVKKPEYHQHANQTNQQRIGS